MRILYPTVAVLIASCIYHGLHMLVMTSRFLLAPRSRFPLLEKEVFLNNYVSIKCAWFVLLTNKKNMMGKWKNKQINILIIFK